LTTNHSEITLSNHNGQLWISVESLLKVFDEYAKDYEPESVSARLFKLLKESFAVSAATAKFGRFDD